MGRFLLFFGRLDFDCFDFFGALRAFGCSEEPLEKGEGLGFFSPLHSEHK